MIAKNSSYGDDVSCAQKRRASADFYRYNAGKPTPLGSAFLEEMCGGVLLSREASLAVPSALRGLTSGFGMGPGVSPSLWPPQLYGITSLGSRPYSGNRIVDASPPVARGIHAMTVSVCQALGLLVPVS